ncbi:MaoC/PaaZ C-terminal domain-containing protein [Amycolatopsis orientalis]|uniref:MaoC/PaaZ C-terminal domain-containing protein n=1 Tax=Amycolatopsis orientalis TaxID=31958 RepID=UPI00039B29B2|nr:MaoC/PaaZ C-terminal domain-containing protein [Amycolatopsis orientalis]
MTDDLSFDDSAIGVWTDPVPFEVTADRIAAYAAATNDPIEDHRKGTVAPPVFAIVPVFESMLEPVVDVVPTSLFGLVVHGEQDFVVHRAIRPGDVLSSRACVIGYEGLSNGTRLTIRLECRDDTDALVNEQYVTCFIRGHDAGRKVGEAGPPHKLDPALREQAAVATVEAHVDDDQTFRYSEASGDPMPIHLDEQVAKDSGLPGIIAHGLCTMAMASWGVLSAVGESDVTRLRRLAVRFSKMVFPGQDLATRVWRTGTANGATTYAFETTAGDTIVLTDGLAEIAD